MSHSHLIFLLKQAYGASLPPASSGSLSNPIWGPNSVSVQNELVNEFLLAPHFRDFPPSRESRRVFWRWVVETLEGAGEEVDERIYDAYLDLLPTRGSCLATRPPSPSHITHFWSSRPGTQELQRHTTLLESRTMIEGGKTGLRTWGASITFANWLIEHPGIAQDRKVLELGTGAGFLGLVIAALQLDALDINHSNLPKLVLSDVDSEVLSRCRQNFQLPCNGMARHPSLEFCLLDWSDALDSEACLDPDSTINSALKGVDVIIGADIVYDPSLVPALTAVLALFFRTRPPANSGTQNHCPCAYLATTVRREQTISAFFSSLLSHRLEYEEIDPVSVSRTQFLNRGGDGASCDVKLVKITRAS